MEARVQGCVTCHGQSGQGTLSGSFPRIAAKPAGYLYNQLIAFRDGTRRYPPMNYLVAYLPDAYLREIAEYYANQRPPFEAKDTTAADPTMVARGRDIATVGDASKGIPPCVACHGARLTGTEPGIPGLVGLRSNYIAAQLTRWRVGSRHAVEPDCMKRIASRLSEADIAAVSVWLAQQEATEGRLARLAQSHPHAARMREPALMRTALRIAIAGVVLVILGAIALALLRPGMLPQTPAPAPATVTGATTQFLTRGEYLARAGDCVACHTAPEGQDFAGGRAMPTPFGNLYVPNITPDDETGIGKWSADDFYRMMHTGISRDGSLMYPAMPFASYTKITREDSDAIYAYLMSVPPVQRKIGRTSCGFRSTSAIFSSAGARCTSRKANTFRIRSNRRSGTVAPISWKASATARCAIPPSTGSADRASRTPSKAE